jgi:SagB-type dehydrogenase family enzyme
MSSQPTKLPILGQLESISLLDTLRRRRSIRDYKSGDLSWAQIGQLAWAAQGITNHASSLRTAPSAGVLFPLELDVATRDGVFRYQPQSHAVLKRSSTDIRTHLSQAAYGQHWVANASCIFVIAALLHRIEPTYGIRARRYVDLEAGHAAQNLLLMATGLELGATPVGAFDDDEVTRVVRLDTHEQPVYLVPVGWPAETAA